MYSARGQPANKYENTGLGVGANSRSIFISDDLTIALLWIVAYAAPAPERASA